MPVPVAEPAAVPPEAAVEAGDPGVVPAELGDPPPALPVPPRPQLAARTATQTASTTGTTRSKRDRRVRDRDQRDGPGRYRPTAPVRAARLAPDSLTTQRDATGLGGYGAFMAELLLERWLAGQKTRITETLFELLRIPSISAEPHHEPDVRRSAEAFAELLRDAGMEHIRLIEPGQGIGLPAAYGDWLHAGEDLPTVLVYGHHDVQPVDPLDEWTSPPFEPVIVDGECRARGAIDDKGQILYQIEAARGLLAERGSLPVNIKFLIEGEEEIGSGNFERLLLDWEQYLATDVVVVSDTGMISPEVPSSTISMRGMLGFDVDLRTASIDLHSGMWGGTVPNAARLAAEMVAELHDADHRVTIPGFYDRVVEISAEEKESLAAQPFDEESFRAQAGGVAFLEGETGFSPLERIGVRPTAEVVGLRGGYAGSGIKTIVPATAGFKVAFRLVPDQRPEEIDAAFRTWVHNRVPAGIEAVVTGEHGVGPAVTAVDHPAMRALADTIESVWGKRPLWTREGGSGPEEALGRILLSPVLFLGVGLPDDRIHAPNERMVMDQFWKGLLAAAELQVRLGELRFPKRDDELPWMKRLRELDG